MRAIIDIETRDFDALFRRLDRALADAVRAAEIEPSFTVEYIPWTFPPPVHPDTEQGDRS